MTTVDDKVPALWEFEDRYAYAVAWELTCKARLEQRDWQVTLTGVEHCLPNTTLDVLHKVAANLCGPDMLAARSPVGVWAIDAKTALPRAQGHLAGMGVFTISERALRAMENYTGAHRIPSLFALNEEAGYFMTPGQVRSRGRCHPDGFWIVSAMHGRPLSEIFGELPEGEAEAVCEVEDTHAA